MATPNYSYEKRQRELAKKRKSKKRRKRRSRAQAKATPALRPIRNPRCPLILAIRPPPIELFAARAGSAAAQMARPADKLKKQ